MSNRSYDVRVVALTIDAPGKWVDNLLSHHDVPGCSGSRQGVSRRISDLGVVAIATVRLLALELGIPMAIAVTLVRDAANERGIDALRTGSGVRIELPPRFIAEVQERLRDALQAAPPRTRGRPPLRAG